jgi:hypothetical protein
MFTVTCGMMKRGCEPNGITTLSLTNASLGMRAVVSINIPFMTVLSGTIDVMIANDDDTRTFIKDVTCLSRRIQFARVIYIQMGPTTAVTIRPTDIQLVRVASLPTKMRVAVLMSPYINGFSMSSVKQVSDILRAKDLWMWIGGKVAFDGEAYLLKSVEIDSKTKVKIHNPYTCEQDYTPYRSVTPTGD